MNKMIAGLLFIALSSPLLGHADEVVAFHIPAGTSSGPWNTIADPIVVHVGQILRLYNDDTISHYLHTDGSPCIHGTGPFNPGTTYDCVIIAPHNAADEDLYDHDQGPDAQVYIQANQN